MTSISPSDTLVAFENVTHNFGRFEALRNLSFTIQNGDIYGLLGLNGAGKTTTIRLMLGLLRAQTGRVMLFGRRQSEAWLSVCDRIGATIEGSAFYPHLTGMTNLDLLYRLSHRRRAGGRTPKEALETVGLAGASFIKVRKYSMGMLQRLYLAQALLTSPEFLVLDEPTSNLDPKGIMDVRRLIQKLNREEGVTVLLSSHQLAEVEDLCNRVAILNRGRIIVESSVSDLFKTEDCQVEIQADSADRAIQLIQGLEWCSETIRDEERIRTRVLRARRGELNTLLVREGITVSEFSERRPTLEDYFHKRIAEDAA